MAHFQTQLPPEIWTLIMEESELNPLYNCCMVSRAFQHFAEPSLYHTIDICFWNEDDSLVSKADLARDMAKFMTTVATQPRLAKLVKRFCIRYDTYTAEHVSLIAEAFKALVNVRYLKLQTDPDVERRRDKALRPADLELLLRSISSHSLDFFNWHVGTFDYSCYKNAFPELFQRVQMPDLKCLCILQGLTGDVDSPVPANIAPNVEYLGAIPGEACRWLVHHGVKALELQAEADSEIHWHVLSTMVKELRWLRITSYAVRMCRVLAPNLVKLETLHLEIGTGPNFAEFVDIVIAIPSLVDLSVSHPWTIAPWALHRQRKLATTLFQGLPNLQTCRFEMAPDATYREWYRNAIDKPRVIIESIYDNFPPDS